MTRLSHPDTATAKAAIELVTAVSDAFLTHHVWRSWYFGRELVAAALADADLEVAFVAAMLHDLGFTERYDSEEPFELAGAAAARSILSERGWAAERAGLVSEAIARHLDSASAEARPEVALVHLGATADVYGLRIDEIPGEVIDQVLAAHPRDGVVEGFVAVTRSQIARKPESKIALHAQDRARVDLVFAHPLDQR